MITETAEPGPNVVPILTAIEGGRNIEGNEVVALFAAATEELSVETSPMAGFAVVVWDDEGNIAIDVHVGARTPFSPLLIPMFASDLIKAEIVRTGT